MAKIAYLVYSTVEEKDEYGKFVRVKEILTRYSNPVIDGKFTGHAWFSPPEEVGEDPQTLADRYGEVVFDKDTREYIYPQKQRREYAKSERRVIEGFGKVFGIRLRSNVGICG